MKKPLAIILILILIICAVPALTFALGSTGETESSKKEITGVKLLDSSKTVIAEGKADEDTWIIEIPFDTDEKLIQKIGASADIFMQIDYEGASLKQEDGYDDAGQARWSTGTILCGVSVNSQKAFTVTAEDGSTKVYTIGIVYDDSPKEQEEEQKPDVTRYHVNTSTPPGGRLISDTTTAAEGDSVIITVVPDEGYRMIEGSLAYTLNVAGGDTVKITGNRFQMPNCDVTVSCQWEEVPVESDIPEEAEGIVSFVICGREADIIRSGAGQYVISAQLPYGSDVTALIPTIGATSGVKLTPGSGETKDFSQPVNYTAELPDGSVLTYVVIITVADGTPSERMWHDLTDPDNQTPWWEYADDLKENGGYPKYW